MGSRIFGVGSWSNFATAPKIPESLGQHLLCSASAGRWLCEIMMLFQHKLFHSCRELKEEKEKGGWGQTFGGEKPALFTPLQLTLKAPLRASGLLTSCRLPR